MYLNLTKLIAHKGRKIFIRNIISVFLFALLYYLLDFFIVLYPDFAEKYLLSKNINNKNNNKHILKSPQYYLWFSLITQTTVGYNAGTTVDNKSTNYTDNRSFLFKIFNIMQLFSILLIPIFV